jgi:membrane associated rhomboid family serine protease/WD40 repeat protein
MQDDPLSSVVLLVAVVAVMQAVGLFRQRHPWNTPMLAILGGLAASALATTSLLGEAKLYAELAVLGVGVALVALPSLPERVSTLARVRGEFRRAARFGLLLLVLRPTARSRALYRLSKALRLLDSPAGVGNLAAADALARFPVRVSLFSVEVVYREVRTRLSWLARRAAGLPWEPVAGATELASPAFSAALPFVVQTLVAEGRAEEAAELLLQAERAAEEPDVVVPEEVDAYHNRARLLFAAHAGAPDVLARALRFGSTVRPLVTARERSSLRERAATATALPPELCAPILASLEREARLPSMLTAWQAPGPLSIALFVVNLVTYALSSWSGDLTDRAHLERIGAVSRHLLAEGQLFRLFSSAFLHANWIHLAFNMGALVLVGGVVERLLGSAAFLFVYLAAALVGSAAGVYFGDAQFLVGASGAIFGLIGAAALTVWRARGELPPRWLARNRRIYFNIIVANIGLSFAVAFVSASGHVGGLLAGAAVAALWLALDRKGSVPVRTPQRALTFFAALVWLVVGTYSLRGAARAWSAPPRAAALQRFEDSEGSLVFQGPHGTTLWSNSLSGDGRLFASGSEDGTARVWDVTSQQLLRAFHCGPPVTDVGLSADGRRLAATSFGVVRVFDVESGARLWESELEGVFVVAVSSRGELALGGASAPLAILDLETGAPRSTLRRAIDWLPLTARQIRSLSFSADGRYLAEGGSENTVRIWDRDGGAAPVSLPGPSSEGFGAALFAAGGSVALVFHEGGPLRFWDGAASAYVLEPIPLAGERTSFHANADLSRAVVTDATHVRVVDPRTGAVLFDHPTTDTESAWLLPDGASAVTMGGTSVRLREVSSWEPRGTFGGDLVLHATALTFSPDGARLYVAGELGVRVFEVGSGRRVGALFEGENALFEGVALSPDGALVAGVTGTRALLADAASGATKWTGPGAAAVVFSPDERYVLTAGAGSERDRLTVLDRGTGEVVRKLPAEATNITSLSFLEGKNELVAGLDGGGAVLFGGGLWDPLFTSPPPAAASSLGTSRAPVVASHRGDWFVASTPDAEVRRSPRGEAVTPLWSAVTPVALALSRDDRWLAVAGLDGGVRLLATDVDALSRGQVGDTAGVPWRREPRAPGSRGRPCAGLLPRRRAPRRGLGRRPGAPLRSAERRPLPHVRRVHDG